MQSTPTKQEPIGQRNKTSGSEDLGRLLAFRQDTTTFLPFLREAGVTFHLTVVSGGTNLSRCESKSCHTPHVFS